MIGARRKVRRLWADPQVTAVVVEHRDRLGRMNAELVQAGVVSGRSPAGGARIR
jgi:putative resolvase